MRLNVASLLIAGVTGCSASGAPAAGPQPATIAISESGSRAAEAEALTLTMRAGGTPHTSAVAAPADSVFSALERVYTALGIELTQLDRRTRTLGNVRFRRTDRLGSSPLSDVMRCGPSGTETLNAGTYPVTLTVVSTVAARGSSSLVTTRVAGTATPSGSGPALQCTSTGGLERAIVMLVHSFMRMGR